MASRFDFYSFSGYEFLISTIQFLLVKMLISDIMNVIIISNKSNFRYQKLPSQLLISEIHFQISEINIVTSDN